MESAQNTKSYINRASGIIERHPNLLVLFFLGVLSLVVFWPMLVGGRVLMCHEFVNYYYPARTFFKESLFAGDFPLWSPYPAGGTFFLANPWNSTFYPPLWLYLILPQTYTLGLLAVFHIIIFAFFSFRTARTCNVSFLGSLIVSLAAYLGGVTLIIMEYGSNDLGPGIAWLPAIIFCFICLLKAPGVTRALWLALACAMQVLSGSPYPPFYSAVAMAVIGVCYAIFNRLSVRAILVRSCATVAASIAAFLLCAPQLIPMLVAVRGIREFGKETLFPKEFSMRIADWLTAVAPNLLGVDETFKCFYLGLPVVMLAGFGAYWLILRKISKTPLPPSTATDAGRRGFMLKMAATFAFLAAVGLIFSFGGYLSLDAMLDKLPLVGRCTRWMSLMGILFVISIGVLAGVGFDLLMEAAESRRLRRAILIPLIVFVCIGAGLLIFKPAATSLVELFRAHYWRWIHTGFIPDGINLKHFPPGIVVVKSALLLIVSAVLLAIPFLTRWKRHVIFALIAACILADHLMFYQARHISATSAIDIYTQKPPIADYLNKKEPDGLSYRVYIPGVLTQLSLMAFATRDPGPYLYMRSYMSASTGLQYRISTSNTLGAFREGGVQYFLQPWLESLPPGFTRDYIFGLWNVKYIIDYSITPEGRLQTTLRENPHVQPRAWLSYAKYPVNSLADSLRQIQANPMGVRGTVILVDPNNAGRGFQGVPGTSDIESISYTNNTVTITATAERDGFLYLSDTYEQSWRAYVDDKETKIFRANMNGRAVAFPEGRHTVLFRYSPLGFWIGLWIGVVAWLALAVFGAREFYLRRKIKRTGAAA